MIPHARIGLVAAILAAGMVAGPALPSPLAYAEPFRQQPRTPKPYRERIRYRKRREWSGGRNEGSLLDRARGAVAR